MTRRRYHTPSQLMAIEPEAPPFPLFAFFLTTLTLAAAFYFVLVECPAYLLRVEGASAPALWTGRALTAIVVGLGTRPILALLLFAGLLAPGFVSQERSRPYFLSVIFGSFIVLAVCFVFTQHPARRLGDSVQRVLSMERELPSYLPDQTQ